MSYSTRSGKATNLELCSKVEKSEGSHSLQRPFMTEQKNIAILDVLFLNKWLFLVHFCLEVPVLEEHSTEKKR